MYRLNIVSYSSKFIESNLFTDLINFTWFDKKGCKLEIMNDDLQKLSNFNVICITTKMELEFNLNPQQVVETCKDYIETCFSLEKNSLLKISGFKVLGIFVIHYILTF